MGRNWASGLRPFLRTELFWCFSLFLMPLPVPKIEKLSQKMVDKYHVLYMDTLRRLFDQYKVKFDSSDTQELVKV